jgi:hypothetical protein
MTGELLRNPCDSVASVVTKTIGLTYKVRPEFELVTQVSDI